jgi:hypothetical protein
MKLDILVPIVVIIGCLILIVIRTNNQENFKSEKRESPMFLPIPEPTFISNIENKKDLIIINEDNNNNFPISKYELKIDPPKPYDGPVKKDQPFKDVNFVRDKGVSQAMNQRIEFDDTEYAAVVNGNLQFKYPTNSNDYLTSVDIKNISKEELDKSTLFEIYDKMSVKVVNNISKEQIDNITGKPIDYNESNLDLYKPILSLIDKNLEINSLDNDIMYKYEPYVKPINGSLL